MSESTRNLPVPTPRLDVRVRPATPDDLPFIDALQKKTTKQVGFMPTKQFEGKIARGEVLVAEVNAETGNLNAQCPDSGIQVSAFRFQRSPAGYLIGADRYFKRDDVGIIYQLNVAPQHRRSLVAAALLKAQFDRSAYGCRLYCCWCAQDLEANRFWEAMGFVPLAFRAGSERKSRVHIFWQKRICEGDKVTPWWFPSQTTGGGLREDRLVLPIPPGTHWSDAVPLVLPGAEAEAAPALPAPRVRTPRRAKVEAPQPATAARNGLRFAIPAPTAVATESKPAKAKPPREKRRNDPRLVAAARELKDRWLEEVNAGRYLPPSRARYDVARALPGVAPLRQLAA